MDQRNQGVRLSSAWTPFDRLFFVSDCLLSAFLLVGWLLLTAELWLLLLSAGFAIRSAFSWRRYWHLKDITILQDTVYASSFAHTTSFPLSSITGIDLHSSGQHAVMNLREPTSFGYCLHFAPRGRTVNGRNPLIDELREQITAVGGSLAN